MSKDLQNVLEVIDDIKEKNRENAIELKNSLQEISFKLEEISEGSEFIFVRNTIADFKNSVSEKFERIASELEVLHETAEKNGKDENSEILIDKFKSVSSIFESSMSLMTSKLEDIESNFTKSAENNFEGLKKEFSKLSNELSIHQQEIIDSHKEYDENTVDKFSFVAESIKMLSENLNVQTKIYKEFVEEKINEVDELLNKNSEDDGKKSLDLKEDIEKRFSEIDSANTGLSNALENAHASVKEVLDRIDNLPQRTSDALARGLGEINTSTQDALTEIKVLQDYSLNMTKILNGVEEFTKENKIASLQEAVKELDITNNIRNLFDKIDIFNNNFNIKSQFLEEQVGQLKGMFSDVATEMQVKDAEMLAKQSERIKEYYGKVDEVTASLMNLEQSLKLSGVEYKEHVTNLNKELTDFIGEFNSIYSEMSGAMQVEINQSLDELKQYININSTNYNDRLIIIQEQFSQAFKDLYEVLKTNNFELIESGLHAQQGLGEEATKLLNSISARVDILAETDYNDNFDELYAKSNQTQELVKVLHEKVDGLALSQSEDNNFLLQVINTRVDELTQAAQKQDKHYELNHEIIKLINEIDTKLDVLAAADYEDNFEKISERITGYKELLDEINVKIDTLALIDYSDDLDKIAQDVSGSKSLMNELSAKLDVLAMGDDNEEIHDELQEIKDIILEQKAADKSGENGFTQNAAKNVIQKLDNIAQTLADNEKNTNDSYSYTLIDVENDIAKLRQVLNKISEATPANEINQISQNLYGLTSSIEAISKNLTPAEIYQLKQNILKLNDDILSISSRTNKLILSSDESQKTIADGVMAFSHIAYDLQEKMEEISNKDFNREMATKIEKMQMMLENSASMNSTFQKVFMFLGEWVDKASATFESINTKADEIEEISEALSVLRKTVPEKVELIDMLEERFEEQQTRLDRLEAKLNEVVELAKLNNNALVLQKVDNMEKLVTSLHSSVEKLTSYVD